MWRLAALATTICTALGVACGSSSARSTESSAHKLQTVKVVSGSTVPDPVSWALYVGIAKGFFKDQGVSVQIATASSGTAALSEVTSGQEEVDFAGLEPLPAANEVGGDLAEFFVLVYRPTWELTYFTSDHSIAALKGQPVGAFSAASASLPLLAGELAKAGLTMADVKLVPTGGAATTLAAVQAGQVKAEMMTLEYAAFLKDAGVKYSEVTLPGYVGDYPGEGAITSNYTIVHHKSALVAFTRGLIQADKYCNANINGCAAAYRKAVPSTTVSTTLLRQQIAIDVGLSKLPKATKGKYGLADTSEWDNMIKLQLSGNVISHGIGPNNMFTNSIATLANKPKTTTTKKKTKR